MIKDYPNELITIIIPVYNVADYLPRCIESVITQDYSNLEIILVDDGSEDESSDICDDYAKKDDRIIVIHKKNGGLSSARNFALDIMKGSYIFFIDSDDYIFPGIIKKLYVSCLKYNAQVACCGYTSGHKSYYTNEAINVMDNVCAAQKMFICEGIDSNAVCKLYKKELFEQIRYPLCAYEVVPVTYRVLLRARKVVNIYESGYYIEKRANSITRSEFGSNNLLYVNLALKEYEKIAIEFPALKNYAYSFYLNALVSMRERAENSPQKKYSYEFQSIDSLFKKDFYNILKDKHMQKRKKIISILLKIHLYKPVFKLYRFAERI